MNKRFCFILLLLSQLACQANKNSLEELKTEEYSIFYPSSIEPIDDIGNETEFVLVTKEFRDDDNFRENINLIIFQNFNNSLKGYAKNVVSKIKDNSRIIENNIIEKNNLEIHRIILEEVDNDVKLIFVQHSLISKNKLYVLTFSSNSSDYEEYYNVMNEVMSSFKLR